MEVLIESAAPDDELPELSGWVGRRGACGAGLEGVRDVAESWKAIAVVDLYQRWRRRNEVKKGCRKDVSTME